MPRIVYEKKRFRAAALTTIDHANQIIEDYRAQGYDLTLRQLYYKLVTRGLIANLQSEYKRLGSIINDARLAGLVDWSAIVDRTRNVRSLSHWATPHAILQAAADGFNIDRWKNQPLRVMVLIEKDALVGVFGPVCQNFDVPLLSCRGYTSQSELWSVAQRLGGYLGAGQRVLILHFGDHDPSGLDMTRDIEDRLKGFLTADWTRAVWDAHRRELDAITDSRDRYDWVTEHGDEGLRTPWRDRFEVRRMALNWEQIQQYMLPPNPAKDTDARFQKYREEFGDESWELDALEPSVLGALVRDTITDEYDPDKWDEAETEEAEGRRRLRLVANRWSNIQEVLDK